MASRRKGRILATQALYAWEASRQSLEAVEQFSWLDADLKGNFDEDTLAFARYLVRGTLENIGAVDAAIRKQVEHWDFDRIARVELAVLRMSVYALLFQPSIPATVTIDEAVGIAKEFSGDEAYRFVNGVLDGIRKAVLRDDSRTS